MKLKVLFLCATNGVESPMAEALLNRLASAHFEVSSAGIDPGETHPLAVEVMNEIGIDLQGRVAKAAHDVLELGFDFVITLCERAKSECPAFSGGEFVHWQFDDPLTALDHTEQVRMFHALREQIAQRIRLFVLVQAPLPRVRLDTHRTASSRPLVLC